jgi:serine/threonine protein phosphatase PrpC
MNVQEALQLVSQTHTGMVRTHNEDSVACEAACGLAVLADGMGGYNAGEVASGIAVSVLSAGVRQQLQNVRPEETDLDGEKIGLAVLRETMHQANTSIYTAAQSQPQYAGMGTTVVAALFFDNRVVVAHVGDSRMYRLREDKFEAMTRDHSVLQEQIDRGIITREDARLSRNKNLVTRAVGIDAAVEPEIATHQVQVGDIYLLCSDGLNDMVPDAEIGATLGMLQGNLPLAATQLIDLANDNGGRDNVSVILVKVNGEFGASSGWLAKLASWFKN